MYRKMFVIPRKTVGMPICANCDGFVTETYVQVFAPTGRETVRVCPHCPDKLRDGADVREAHPVRRS